MFSVRRSAFQLLVFFVAAARLFGGEDASAPAVSPAPIRLELSSVFQLPSNLFGTETRRISLSTAIFMALANNQNLRARRLDPEIRNAIVQSTFGRFDPRFLYATTYQNVRSPQNAEELVSTGAASTETQLTLIDTLEALLAEIQGESPGSDSRPRSNQVRIYETENLLNRASISGLLPLGTQYEFFLSYDQFRNSTNRNSPPSLFYPEFGSSVGVRLIQPLLRGFGPAATMMETRVARLDRRIGWLDWREEMENVVTGVALAYYDLALAYENLAVREDNLNLARQLVENNRRRVQMGRMSEFEVLEARSAAMSREEELYVFTVELANRLAALRALVFSPSEINNWVELVPSEPLRFEPFAVDRNLSQGMARRRNTRLLKSRLDVEKREVMVDYRRNQVLPEVNLQGGVTGLSSAGSYGGAVSDAFNGQGVDFNIGVTVSIPLGNVEERANLAAAKLLKEQSNFSQQGLLVSTSSEIDALVSRVLIARARLQSARDAARLAAETLAGANQLLEEGRTTSFEVLRFQNNLALARSQENAAIAEHQKAIVLLSQREGSILDFFGILLEKEAWRDRPATRPREKELREMREGGLF
jgi:outer membrane protein